MSEYMHKKYDFGISSKNFYSLCIEVGVPYITVHNVSLPIGGGGSSFRKLDKGEGHILEGRIGGRVTFYGSTVPRKPPTHPPVITEGSLSEEL